MDQETTYKWIQERLRELNSGTLSEADKSRLVTLAKEDPFVADALEGFHAFPEIDHTVTLDRIALQIKHVKRERRRWLIPNLTITAIAASFLIILATYAVITRIEKKGEETLFVFVAPDSLLMTDTVVNDIAMESESGASTSEEPKSSSGEPATKTEARESAPIVSSSRIESKVQPGSEQSESVVSEVTATESIKSIQPSSIPAAPPPTLDDQIIHVDGLPIQTQPVLAGAQSKESSRAKRDEGFYANQMDPDIMNSRVTGRVVVSSSGEPLPFTKLSVSYSNQIFYTDINGYFELYLPAEEEVLNVTFTGLVDSTMIIRQGEENILVGLNEGVILTDIQIVGLTNKGPLDLPKNPAIESYFNIHRYITSNTTLQLTTESLSARRKVTVEFRVNNEGRPKNISVLESSRDKMYDGEAMRLIESGPDWVCPGGEYPCIRQYTFHFR